MSLRAEGIDVRLLFATLPLSLALGAAPPALAKEARQLEPAKGEAASACITRPQLEGLITYALPSLIEGVAKKCAGSLAESSFLRRSAPALAERYRLDSDRHWPMARAAVTSMAGTDISSLGETTEKAMVTSIVGVAIAESIKPSDCGSVDEAVELLSPLPAANLGKLTAMLAILGSKDDQPGESAFAICPAAGGE
ncbi:hypothetical protein SAMN06295912_101119 [Sphingomonas laterariae]|uniref:Uncharacterized protein n=1 Tax=Edaphosphingomonas laterariae TaxID=861865 RepID=A0A239BGD7_9SPHN|nr:hypothetical protein [Sphingomonas laterariae]SNS06511.1 hypothetical protein SAMN06295912_101119 [Sphingomonas laterariae]